MAVKDKTLDEIITELSQLFSVFAKKKGARATHSVGITCEGTAKLLGNLDGAPASQDYTALLRHANVRGEPDDAALDARGASLRLTDQTTGHFTDFLLNTGPTFFASNAQVFRQWMLSTPAEKESLVANGSISGRAIETAFRSPSSYSEVYYYSQIAYAKRGNANTFYKFRLIPGDRQAERGVMPAGFKPGSVTFFPRSATDSRVADYLRKDFSARVLNGGVRYLLQFQQAVASTEAERDELLDCTREWQNRPWVDFVEVSLTTVLGAEDPTAWNLSHLHPELELSMATAPLDPASIATLRLAVYSAASSARIQASTYEYDAGKLPRFSKELALPPEEVPTRHYRLLSALTRPIKPSDPPQGVVGVYEEMGADALTIMPPNRTKLEPQNRSDNFFLDRRLNGFLPGQLQQSSGTDWDFVITHDYTPYAVKPNFRFINTVECRFKNDGELRLHSIRFGDKEAVPGSSDWAEAKQTFLDVEFLMQELQFHLGRCHINLEQYAMAFRRNISRTNPFYSFLAPHFEGLININKRGDENIIGPTGFITLAGPLQADGLIDAIHDELKRHDYHRSPLTGVFKGLAGDRYSRSATATWEVILDYVEDMFAKFSLAGQSKAEYDGMSEDLVKHSVQADDTLKVQSIEDLKTMSAYIIYHSIFLHPWTNYNQYNDGGDPEFVRIGRFDHSHPTFDPKFELKTKITQVNLTHFLSSVRYKPVMVYGMESLRDRLLARRTDIEPGLSLDDMMLSISI